MGQRADLGDVLKGILGSNRVYFQPPQSIKLSYPCILYQLSKTDIKYADNKPYNHSNRYTVTIIDKNPDSEINERMKWLPMVSFDRIFVSDNLYHYVYSIYY